MHCLEPHVNSFHWETGTGSWANGGIGFTLYDQEKKIIYNRPLTMANLNQQEDISVAAQIAEIFFNGTSDGFHGSFIVRDSEGLARKFHCTNCLDAVF